MFHNKHLRIIFIAIFLTTFSSIASSHILDSMEKDELLERSQQYRAIKQIFYNAKKYKWFDGLYIIQESDDFKLSVDANGNINVEAPNHRKTKEVITKNNTDFDLWEDLHIVFDKDGKIKSLSLRGAPPEIFQLLENVPSLLYINLYETNINNKKCPNISIVNLPSIVELRLKHNNICSIGFSGSFNSLKTLNLFSSKVSNINNLSLLQNLLTLDLYDTDFTSLPTDIYTLKNLEHLEISNLKLDKVSRLDDLVSLRKLEATGLKTKSFPSIENLKQLKHLDIHGSDAALFIDNYPINLEYLSLVAAPKCTPNLKELKHLKKLYLSACGLNKIPDLSSQKKLKVLYLANNPIKNIENMDNLLSLEELDISNTEIKSLNGLGSLKSLQTLTAKESKISSISGLFELTNLKKAYLNENPINEINDLSKFSTIKSLEYLDLAYTEIEKLDVNKLLKLDIDIRLTGSFFADDLEENNPKLFVKLLRADKI